MRASRGRCGARDGRALFYVSDRGGAENIWTRPATAGRTRSAAHVVSRRPRAVADDHDRRPHDRVRARLRHLDARHGDGPGAPGADRPSRRGDRRRRRSACGSDVAVQRPRARRPTAARSRSSRAATSLPRRPATAATPRASRARPAIESQPVWAPDSRRLAYVSARDGGQQICSVRLRERQRRRRSRAARRPISRRSSRPNGKQIAFLRNRRELRVIDVATKADRVLATGTFADTIDEPRPVWSPDGTWIALLRDRHEVVHERRARARCRRRAAAAGELPRERVCRTRSRGVATARTSCSTRASAPSPASSRASTSRCARRSSARICSAICSASPCDTDEPHGSEPKNPGTPPDQTRPEPGTPEPRPSTGSGRPELAEGGTPIRFSPTSASACPCFPSAST